MRTVWLSALLCVLSISALHAEELHLTCSGTYFLYQDGQAPQKATHDAVLITINETLKTLQVGGTVVADATGPLYVEEGHYWSVIPHHNVAEGVRYPYIGVNVNRMTGVALIFSLTKDSFEGMGKTYFNGTCSRSKQLF